MRKKDFFYAVMACVLLAGATACSHDDQEVKDEIPAVVQNDFSARYPAAKITSFRNFPDGLHQITFLDSEENEGLTQYARDDWKMTYTKVNTFQQLPLPVQRTFKQLQYRDANIIEMYKTERAGIAKSLYTLYFRYPWKNVAEVEHYVFINNDGLLLSVFTWKPNNPNWFVNLSKDQFDFIAKKYDGAEIRGYINNLGDDMYFILHKGIIKSVYFGGDDSERSDFWKETRYELERDFAVPDNVLARLKQMDPEFTYTKIYYIESRSGHAYSFVNKNSENDLGYTIGE
jgi:hypothetical protein